MPLLTEHELRTVETQLLLEGVYRCHGLDFREYSRGSLDRRLQQCLRNEGLATLSSLQDKLLHDAACMQRVLLTLTIHTTAMFRDPRFYLAFARKWRRCCASTPFCDSGTPGVPAATCIASKIFPAPESVWQRCSESFVDMAAGYGLSLP